MSSRFYEPLSEYESTPDPALQPYDVVHVPSEEGSRLEGWLLRPSDREPIASVLHFHGNRGNISYHDHCLQPLVQAGMEVLTFDYRGFGKSAGKATQKSVLQDGLSALSTMRGRLKSSPRPLILFGQSMGGHLAVVVAGMNPGKFDALVTEGAFSSHQDMAAVVMAKRGIPGFLVRLLMVSPYDAVDWIGSVTEPKLIVHSTEDAVVPFSMGRDLFELAREPKQFWKIEGRHLQAAELYPDAMAEKFKALADR